MTQEYLFEDYEEENESSAHYIEKRDGSLKDYIRNCKRNCSNPLFKGHKAYHMLWDQGYLEPGVSRIRLMFNHARGDGLYDVVSRDEVEGIVREEEMHSGKEGKYSVLELLSGEDSPCFEAEGLNPDPKPRKRG